MNGWRHAHLGTLCDEANGTIRTGPFGSQLHESDYSDLGTPVVMPKDILDGRVSEVAIARVSEEHARRLSQHRLAVGDIVYGRRGDIGRRALITAREAGWLCGTGCLRISPGTGELLPRFLFYALGHPKTVDAIAKKAVGATMLNLNTTILREVELVVPPLSVQHRIASILGTYDDLIEVNRRRIALLEEMARRLFEEWFVHFRFPGSEARSASLPEGWRLVRLGDIAILKGGEAKVTKAAFVEHGYVAFSASGPDGFLPTYRCSGKAVVVSGVGAYCGRTWLARGRWTGIANTFYVMSKGEVSNEFLYFATKGMEKWPRRGAAQPFIAREDAAAMEVLMPSEDLHNRFSAFADAALSAIAVHEAEQRRLAASRDLLLPRLISGELSVSAAERELEAAA
jgi:type I restriction enzyme, S subunit